MPRVGYTTTCRRSLVGSFNRFPRRTLAGSVRHRVAPPEPHHLPFERYQSNGSIFELATVIDVGFKSGHDAEQFARRGDRFVPRRGDRLVPRRGDRLARRHAG